MAFTPAMPTFIVRALLPSLMWVNVALLLGFVRASFDKIAAISLRCLFGFVRRVRRYMEQFNQAFFMLVNATPNSPAWLIALAKFLPTI